MSQTSEKSLDTAIDATWLNWLPISAGLLAVILIVNYVFIFYKLPINENSAALGAFGDYIGGLLNPLISLFTLMVAMKVWNLQKIELIETRKAVEEQGKTAEQQRREQRFFDLLNLYQETLKTFVIKGVSGKAAFNNWQEISKETENCLYFLKYGLEPFNTHIAFNSLALEDAEFTRLLKNLGPPRYIILTKEEIESSWNAFSPQLDHYFRTIFSILGQLEKLLGSDHWRYAKLFRAQLSRDELTLLAFNLLFDEEGKKMRPLVAKYGLLKHLAKTKLRDHAIAELDSKSFGLSWVDTQKIATPREECHAD